MRKIQSIPGLCLGAGLLLTTPLLMAEDKGKETAAPAASQWQIRIDPATGMKIGPDDSVTGESVRVINAPGQRLKSADAGVTVQHHPNGMISAEVPETMMMNLVMTIDENGKRTVRHLPAGGELNADTAHDHGETH